MRSFTTRSLWSAFAKGEILDVRDTQGIFNVRRCLLQNSIHKPEVFFGGPEVPYIHRTFGSDAENRNLNVKEAFTVVH